MRKQMYWKIIVAIAAFFLYTGLAEAYTYFNDFEGDPATWKEWSPNKKATTPTNRNFLGYDPRYGFANHTAVLTLPNFPAGLQVDVEFDLFIIKTWDGNHYPGLDYWKLYTGDGQVLLNTTFYSTGHGSGSYQSYSDNYPANNPAETGATEKKYPWL